MSEIGKNPTLGIQVGPIVNRKGEGPVRLRVRFKHNILGYTFTNIGIIDRIDNLLTKISILGVVAAHDGSLRPLFA